MSGVFHAPNLRDEDMATIAGALESAMASLAGTS